MALEVVTIPCLADNYAYLLQDTDTGQTALVDAPEPGPIFAELTARGWPLHQILLTHHHWDHIDGALDIQKATGAKIVGATADANRLPPLDISLNIGDTHMLGSQPATIIDVSGHTIGHIAFLFKDAKAAFTADSLMALGCGRLFEGDFDMMWTSLSQFLGLPRDTIIYSGHEYTESNARFAITIEPDNADLKQRVKDITAARAKNHPTVPSTLDLELRTNPFLRAHLPETKAAIGMPNATDADVFAEIRTRKDNL